MEPAHGRRWSWVISQDPSNPAVLPSLLSVPGVCVSQPRAELGAPPARRSPPPRVFKNHFVVNSLNAFFFLFLPPVKMHFNVSLQK